MFFLVFIQKSLGSSIHKVPLCCVVRKFCKKQNRTNLSRKMLSRFLIFYGRREFVQRANCLCNYVINFCRKLSNDVYLREFRRKSHACRLNFYCLPSLVYSTQTILFVAFDKKMQYRNDFSHKFCKLYLNTWKL